MISFQYVGSVTSGGFMSVLLSFIYHQLFTEQLPCARPEESQVESETVHDLKGL